MVMMKAELLFWVFHSPGPSEELKPHKTFYMRGSDRGREEDRELETRVDEVISGSFCVMHNITRSLHTWNYRKKDDIFLVAITKCLDQKRHYWLISPMNSELLSKWMSTSYIWVRCFHTTENHYWFDSVLNADLQYTILHYWNMVRDMKRSFLTW